MDIGIVKVLGAGMQGMACLTSEGDVLKLTFSAKEAVIADILRDLRENGHEFRHFPHIKAIFRIGSAWGILREEIPDVEHAGIETRDAIEMFGNAFETGDAELLDEACRIVPSLESLRAEMELFHEKTLIRIQDIINPDNYGGTLDRLFVRDFGIAQNVPSDRVEHIVLDEVTLLDMSSDPALSETLDEING